MSSLFGFDKKIVLWPGGNSGGIFRGLNGQTITGDANGAWAIAANGTNQSITLTPNGTGGVTLTGAGSATLGLLRLPTGTTLATGVALGTDVFFFRNGTNAASINASAGLTINGDIIGRTTQSNTTGTFVFQDGSGYWGLRTPTGSNPGVAIDTYSGSAYVQAVLFDSSQNATFAGSLKHASSTWNFIQTTTHAYDFYNNTSNLLLELGATGQIYVPSNSAASTPIGYYLGTWFTGGNNTTTKPHFLIEPTGATSTNWASTGTGLGINAASGFAGNLVSFQVNASEKFYVSSAGNIGATAGSFTGLISGSANLTLTGTSIFTKVGGAIPLITTSTAITSGAGAQVGTLTNSPTAGNPTSWVPINDNGTTRYIPAW